MLDAVSSAQALASSYRAVKAVGTINVDPFHLCCIGESFPFGLTCILEAEVVHACGCKCECDVCDAIAEGAAYAEGACMEVCVPST